jgi:hypothetical protein
MLEYFEKDDDFILYEFPKQGVFRVETGEYKLPGGWVQIEEKSTIIGETSQHYVTGIINGEIGMWEGDKVVKYKYTSHPGYHKSRFVRWCDTQLVLELK